MNATCIIRSPKHRFSLAGVFAALAISFALPAFAAGEFVSAKKQASPARQDNTASKPVTAEPARSAVSRPGDASYADQPGQLVFQVLLAEIALRRGDAALASTAYADLALRSRDPKVLERTVEIAGYARRWDLALEAARLWAEVDPESKRAQYVLASVMVMSNQTDDLVPVLIRMLEVDKEALADNLMGLNRLLARIPDRRAAFQVVEKVCRPFFGIAESHYAVSVAAAGAGQMERARAEARRALELRPDWETAALLQGQLLMRVSADEAVAFLQEFVDKNPKAREARMQMARMLVSAKRYDEARQQFEQLLKTSPDSPDVVFSVAILALQQHDLAIAEAQFKHFLTLPVADRNYANYFLGQIAEERKQAADAVAYYDKVMGGEHFIQAKLRSARLLVDLGKPDEARRMLSSAKTSSAEESIQLTIAEAGLLRDAKKPREAFDLLESLLTKQPDQTDLLYETALLAEKIGKIELMESRLRKLIELRPESAQAYNALGYSLADRNQRLPEARELIEKALKISPDDYFILDSMGWVLFRQGDFDGALTYLQKAYARHEDPEIAAHIGEVLWVMGRQEDAKQTWLEARKKHPENESLAEVIKKFQP